MISWGGRREVEGEDINSLKFVSIRCYLLEKYCHFPLLVSLLLSFQRHFFQSSYFILFIPVLFPFLEYTISIPT